MGGDLRGSRIRRLMSAAPFCRGRLQQLSVLEQGGIEQAGLLCRPRPVLRLHRLGQTREFEVGIGIARGIQQVLKPWAAGNLAA